MMADSNETNSVHRVSRLLAPGLLLLGLGSWFMPQLLLGSILPELIQFPGSTISIPATIDRFGHGLAVALLLWGGLAFYWSNGERSATAGVSVALALLALIGSYLAMVWTLGSWMIDDAAITFAYSENLIRGNGLVLHPNLPPEEGYSNTLWMLLLALPLLLGIEVSVAGKVLGVLTGSAALMLAYWLALQCVGERLTYRNLLLLALVAMGAPFIVWSASGLETSIQALLFVVVVLAAHRGASGIWLAAAALSGLVLTRPETPLIVASVAGLWALYSWREDGRAGVVGLWPIVVFPVLTTLALLAFRLWYFGDPLPNPYYAKGAGRNFYSVLLGGQYVLLWLLAGFAFALVPLVMLAKPRRWALPGVVAAGILIGQLGFLAFSGGDWMKGYRFIAPALPVFAFLLVYSSCNANPRWSAYVPRLTMLAIPLLALGLVRQLVLFEVNPSTPISRVSELGYGIVDVAERMDIDNPRLAHHDAGGTSYEVGIELLDLGGLGNRYIAKHLNYPRRIWEYVLVDQQPDFIFGSVVAGFAANRSGFHESRKFKMDYVRLEFPDQPHMSANLGPGHLSHVRRELVKPGPGIELINQDGKLMKVIVRPVN